MAAKSEQYDILTYEFKESIDWHLEHGHRLIRLNKYGGRKDPKAPVDKGWRDSEGLTKRQAYRAVRDGHNLGWAPEGEHLIIDVDMHGKNGLATYDKFKKILPPEQQIPRVNSSRGGFHLYLRKESDVKVSVGKLRQEFGKGVDVIANTQVVIPASIHPVTGQPYEFVNLPDDIPLWTPELKKLLTQKRVTKNKKHDEELPDVTAVEQIMSVIPNDDDTEYDDWFHTGCAIHKSTGGSEEGREIFHHWSSLSGLYDADYTDTKWESIGNYSGDMRGFGSLIVEAREYDLQLVSNIIHTTNYVSPETDFADLPPPEKDFDINKRSWRLVEEELSYDDIEPDEWFYQDILPKGAYAAMAGRQGLGKSTLIMHLAACVTNGKPFPGDEGNPIAREPGDVIYFSVEERVKQSILPKLKLSGAVLSRFHAFRAGIVRENRKGEEETRGFSVTDGLKQLEEVLHKYPETRLVIFDPITMFIIHNQSADSNNTVVMNQSLAPLNKLAEDHELCVLGITHFNKSGGRGLDKVTGSIAHTTVARHVTYLLPHYIENHTIVATAKSNMFTEKTSYVFEGVKLEDEFIEGYDTPLKQREIHLLERNTEGLDADAWDRIVEEQLQDQNRRSAVDHLSSQIMQHITENSLQRRYWTSKTFKDYFRGRYAQHDRTFDETIAYMTEQKMLHQENVNGNWYIWYLDGLIADDPEELDLFNETVRQDIRNEHKTAKTALQDEILDFVNGEFPDTIEYEELYEVFDEFSETQLGKAIRQLVDDDRVERIHMKRKYYLSGF